MLLQKMTLAMFRPRNTLELKPRLIMFEFNSEDDNSWQ